MSQKTRLLKLEMLAQFVRDHDMALLNRLASDHELTREKLARLPSGTEPSPDPAMFTVQQAHLRWGAIQQMHLNMVLARQRAALLEQRSKTSRSFGRAEAVAQLLKQHSKKR